MTWVVVGLGNPGEEYTNTRHNAGRLALEHIVRARKLGEWKYDKKSDAQIARGMVEKSAVVFVQPDTFMNKSGSALVGYVKSVKAAEKLVVVYDDLDLPLGKMKLSYDRGSGGHKGIESIERSVKTRRFWRIRVGISPSNAKGVTKKPHGEEDVLNFILKSFKTEELAQLKNVFKRVDHALEMMVTDGPVIAMNKFNQS